MDDRNYGLRVERESRDLSWWLIVISSEEIEQDGRC